MTTTTHTPAPIAPESEADEEEEHLAPAGFRIDSEERAAWAVDHWLSYDEREARLTAQYEKMLAALRKDRDRFRARFGLELEDWLKANPPKKGKSLDLLTGRVGFRASKGGFKLADKAMALAWAKEAAPALVITEQVTVEKLDTDAAIAMALALQQDGNGETIPGIEYSEPGETFYVQAIKVKGEA